MMSQTDVVVYRALLADANLTARPTVLAASLT